MAFVLPNGRNSFQTTLGTPAVGYKLYSYVAGTTTPKATYSDFAATAPNTNPVIADSRGEMQIYWSGAYDVVLKDASNVTVWGPVRMDATGLEPEAGAEATSFVQVGTGAVERTYQDKMREAFTTADFGCAGDGITDDTLKLRAAIAATPEGGTLFIKGLCRITSKVTVSTRISLWCDSAADGIVVDVGTLNDGILYYGSNAAAPYFNGLNGMDIRLNVYGAAACCQHAVVLQRVDRSHIKLNVRAGATAYGVRMRGCLINNVFLESSVNYAPPPVVVSPGMQANHIVVENFGVTNAVKGACSISSATPAVCTFNSHGFSAGQAIVFTGGATGTGVIDGRPYFVLASGLGANSFQFSTHTQSGGVAVNTTGASTPVLASCYPIATNTVRFWVNLEGGGDGYVQSTQPGEGMNTLTGEIEGVTGLPVYVEESLGFTLADIKMEANSDSPYFRGCANLHIGPGVVDISSVPLELHSCFGYSIDGFRGDLAIASTNSGGKLGTVELNSLSGSTFSDKTCNQLAAITNSLLSTSLIGGPGAPTMVTIFNNPFLNIYDANDPAVGPPVGVTTEAAYVSGDAVREATIIFPGSPAIHSLKGLSKGTTITNGVIITPGIQPWKDDDSVSIMVALYCLSTQALTRVYIDDGVTYNYIGGCTAINTWQVVRGSCKLIAGNNWKIRFSVGNLAGSVYVNGFNYYIGAINVTKGSVPPRTIEPSMSYWNHIATSVTYPPSFVGQRAYLTGTGKWYLAKDTVAAGDWIILN